MSKWAQLGLILKSRRSSLKWAQVELNCSIRLGDISSRSLCFFLINVKYSCNFSSLYLYNELSNWAQLGLILKNRRSSLKWAQVEVIIFIPLKAALFQSWCKFEQKMDFIPTTFSVPIPMPVTFWGLGKEKAPDGDTKAISAHSTTLFQFLNIFFPSFNTSIFCVFKTVKKVIR